MSNSLQEMMNYVFVSKSARWIELEKRRETWKESVNRVRNMMLQFYTDKNINDEINWAYDMMLKKKILGSQRMLQYGGEPILNKHMRGYNCTGSPCDRLRFFQECLWLLLCGCGCGTSVQKHHIAKLPSFVKEKNYTKKTFIIPDTIEGWADSLGALLSSYFEEPTASEYYNCKVIFDYSQIRPNGSMLSSGVGKAPGPDGLKNSLEKIEQLLENRISQDYSKLRPIDAHDIICYTSDCVLAGGVRRSSLLSLFSLDDEDMLKAKIGNWQKENPQRARANNSVVLLRNCTTQQQFEIIIQYTKEYGEPGFFFVDDFETIVNPCGEIEMWCYTIIDENKYQKFSETYDGTGYNKSNCDIGLKSGWQACNLSTINTSTIIDIDDFIERGKAAAIIGTLQAGFTDAGYLEEVSRKIIEREALLGVSMTGIMEKTDIVLNPENQKAVAETIKKTNKEIASKIGINQAARTTCCKPEGTSSLILGTSSGIHPHHSKRYLRTIQANITETPYQYFKQSNPQACEPSRWCSLNTDYVICFPIEVPDGAKTKNQIPALELLEIVKNTQINWIGAGKNKALCTQPWLSHNVSNTITVMPDEWEAVTNYIYKNRQHFCGVSLLPHSGDKDYVQAPFTAVYTAKEIVKEYGDAGLWTSGLIEIALEACDKDLWKACDILLAGEPNTNGHKKVDSKYWEKISKQSLFIEKATRFANKYFGGDIQKLTYCMKDIYNGKKYIDLKDSFKSVDYTNMVEREDNTTLEKELSCVGGACLI